ncbi:MAG: isoprenylcysteine carboxylmethyltransferase family protein [Deltaproteobacteria bacterium]|jgi:protein-S-isoprenylcysteine O-methyltransferase Ste14|nr:isoprenylcysteine carboxylmethyltransferase family protein [Deltaproteobacteria bacterium]
MLLAEKFQKSGLFLFKWRSYAPLIFFLVIFASFEHFHYPFQSHNLDLIWELFCLCIGASGTALRVLTVAFVPASTSGRGTIRPSASRLNTTGMYSLVRNPLYLGNFFVYAAPVLFMRIWWILLIFILAFILYYERIIFAEETFLRERFGEEYSSWASKTPAFFPRLRNWTKPDLPFSWKIALSKEYHGAYGLISSLFLMELASDFCVNKELKFDLVWTSFFISGTFFYMIIRFLVKKTSFLK